MVACGSSVISWPTTKRLNTSSDDHIGLMMMSGKGFGNSIKQSHAASVQVQVWMPVNNKFPTDEVEISKWTKDFINQIRTRKPHTNSPSSPEATSKVTSKLTSTSYSDNGTNKVFS